MIEYGKLLSRSEAKILIRGIYTLANDRVYDQLVALLNSIERNVSPNIPICIIPYDDQLELVQREVDNRPNVTLFDNQESLQRWQDFAQAVWQIHPKAKSKEVAKLVQSRQKMQRRHAAFDGDFDEFVVYDADCLAMKPLDQVFSKLQNYDLVFDDWEHRKPDSTCALNLQLIELSGEYQASEVRPRLHCASFFGGKKGLFNPEVISFCQKCLADKQEVNWIRNISEAFLFNYMTLRSGYSLYNFTMSDNSQDRTGNCADADPFINIDNVLYNQQGLKPIHRIHYMNYSSQDFARLCQGEDVDIRYQNEFLYYRFFHQPEQKPKTLKKPSLVKKINRFMERVIKKLPIN